MARREGGRLTPSELAIAAYEKEAREPKELQILPGGHVDADVRGSTFPSGQARDRFLRHLAG